MNANDQQVFVCGCGFLLLLFFKHECKMYICRALHVEVVIIEWTPYITMIEHKEQDDAIKYLALSLNSISL